MRVPIILACLTAACSASPEPAAENNVAAAAPAPAQANAQTDEPAAPPKLAIDGEGLRLFDAKSGSARPLAFGTPREQVVAALAFRGPPELGSNDECSAGRLDHATWPGELTLYFQDDKFIGWAVGEDASRELSTASGLGIGSTRAELESAYSPEVFESTLGTEFSAGEIFGILDGTGKSARVTHLWAGASCNMR